MMNYSQLAPSLSEIAALVQTYYGIKGTAKKLQGEVDFNYYFLADDQSEYTIKVSRPGTGSQSIVFQNEILNHLISANFPLAGTNSSVD